MYVGNDFPDATPDETRRYSFDFSNDLAVGENIASAVWTVSVKSDSPVADPSAASRLSGIATNTSQVSTQSIGGLVNGCIYVLECVVTSTLGAIVSLNAHVRSKVPG